MNTNGIPGPEETRWVTIPKTPETYSHDADGSLLSDGRWIYTWDGENRLFAMESTSSLPAAAQKTRLEFYYDYLSRRSVKLRYKPSGGGTGGTGGTTDSVTVTQLDIKDGGASTDMKVDDSSPGTQINFASGTYPLPVGWALSSTSKFVWDGWNLIAELDGNDAKVRTCAWGLDVSGSEQGAGGIGGLAFEYLAATNATHHSYFDGNGNLTSLRDDTGAISAGYEYGPFGETLTIRGSASALAANAYRFSTKYTDAETGLLYYGYRYYNPGTGRWLNRDPIGEEGGKNLCAFVQNMPIGAIDLHGKKRIVIAFEGFGGYTFGGADFVRQNWQPHLEDRDTAVYRYRWDAVSAALRERSDEITSLSSDRDADQCYYDTVAIIGFSNGAHSAIQLAKSFARLNIRVDELITVDPIPHLASAVLASFVAWPYSKPPNVSTHYNFYQHTDLIPTLRGNSVAGADIDRELTRSDFKAANFRAYPRTCLSRMIEHPRCRNPWKSMVDFS